MTARYVPNPAFLPMLARSETLGDALVEVAEGVADAARTIAKAEAYLSGDYHDGIAVDTGVEGDSVIARVNANDFKSHWVEWGSVHNVAHHPLTRAVEMEGLEVHG